MSTPSSYVAASSGYPQHSDNFIPQIWSGKLLVKFYTATVFAAISNTDYEGEIKSQGDTIFIRTVPDITIRDYTKGQEMTIEFPDSAKVELNIDRAKYFFFGVDDIDAMQSDLRLLDDWSNDAGEQMGITIDSGVLSDVYSDADSNNTGTTAGKISSSYDMGTTSDAVQLTKANILEYMVDAASVLDEQDIPNSNRWFVMPMWATGMIKKSDLKDASLTGDGKSILRNGRIGMIDRWEIFGSNQVASATDGGNTCYHAIFGQKSALSFAAQMTKMKPVSLEKYFMDAIKGLNVYGYKVLKGEAMGDLYCRK